MNLFDTIGAAFVAAGVRLIAPASPTGLASYIGALGVLVLWVIVRRRRAPRWRSFFKAAFPKRILGHVSARADVRLYVLNSLVLPSAFGLMIVGAGLWAAATRRALIAGFGAHAAPATPTWAIVAIATMAEIVMVDFGYWGGHYLMHRIPALWEFHKVHHSAEVMTPLTEWRQHPLEMIVMQNAVALASGVTFGALTYLFGAAQPLSLWGANFLLAIFFLTISHLRHSHVWLPFTGLLGRVLHSPAHHQIHHSADPKHFNRNLGFALSIWDWLFGTLWIPRQGERVVFGIGAESGDFHKLSGSLVGPFVKAARPGTPMGAAGPAGPSR
jgi:sterol desaturase/sphingolipid hydroxylase (fatty acid hydroxylase superfamily)